MELPNYDLFVLAAGAIMFGLFLLIKGGDWTIESAVFIAERTGLSPLFIGATIISFGTSVPELFTSVNANLAGYPGIALGNVLGSNIFNTFMVMGIPGLVGKLTIPETILHRGIPMLIAGTLLLFFTTQDQKLTIWEGWLFLMFYVWFIGRTFGLL